MTITLDLDPATVEQLHAAAARSGREIPAFLKELIERQMRLQALESLRERKFPQTLADLKPRIPPPPGSSGLAQVVGQWPGEETDEEILAALDALS